MVDSIKIKPEEFLEQSYFLLRKNSFNSDWDRADTEALFSDLMDLDFTLPSSEVEFSRLYNHTKLALQCKGDLDEFCNTLNIDQEELPGIICKSEPAFLAVLMSKEATSLLANALALTMDDDDFKSSQGTISAALLDTDLQGEDTTDLIFDAVYESQWGLHGTSDTMSPSN